MVTVRRELLNLMLLGMARSQVFDGIRPVGETGLVLSGVETRPPDRRLSVSFSLHARRNKTIIIILYSGLLSYLEAMRYLEVGSYFKNPIYPIYVISSGIIYCRLLFGTCTCGTIHGGACVQINTTCIRIVRFS